MAGGQAETEPAPPSQAEGPVPGLTHRYPDRVILHATQTCEVYCRFCFRREAVGEGGALAEAEFLRVLAYLSDHPEIWEVILTGGDPLVLSPRRIGDMLARLARIGSVKVIRFHSRIPVVAPERITPALIAALNGPRGGMAGEGAQGAARGDSGNGMARAGEGGPEAAASLIATPAPAADSERETSAPSPAWPAVWMVVHTNHPDEITPRAGAALSMLVEAGIPVLSQSVLLRGINADPDVLEALFRRLIAHRVKPYYLHHPDLAKGTGHFRLPLAEGRRIFAALRGRISGTALPTYVLDIPGGHGKVPVNADYLEPLGHDGLGPGDWIVTDPKGHRHRYRDL
ncbi:KamA family radical SAM protein [Pseudogemmobacter sonorensis]|uniref:KamA family radical SAM protein n=1 Tax=Pseudogemmobacter sonorensis TaxID=2989681 RepID=UPI003F671976